MTNEGRYRLGVNAPSFFPPPHLIMAHVSADMIIRILDSLLGQSSCNHLLHEPDKVPLAIVLVGLEIVEVAIHF